MKATEARLSEVIRKAPQFVIPIYQRTYSWGNGDVEVRIESLNDVQYAVGLARQALEVQVGGGETDPT